MEKTRLVFMLSLIYCFSIFPSKNVMVIVPHEDDDPNLLGDMFEEYIKYGSTVRVGFVSGRNYYNAGEERMCVKRSV